MGAFEALDGCAPGPSPGAQFQIPFAQTSIAQNAKNQMAHLTANRLTIAAISCAFTALSPNIALAIMNDLTGSWTGNGSAYVRGLGDVRAGCRFEIAETKTSIKMDGSCGIGPIRGRLGLDLVIDDDGNVRGTYTGSRSGPAALSGRIRGNHLNMAIRWNKQVNGDRSARMILTRLGPDRFAQRVTDKVDGQNRRTSDFNFRR